MRLGRAPIQLQNKRYVTASLWLNHNELVDIRGLSSMMIGLIEQPEALSWLDLSFNKLTDIDDVSDAIVKPKGETGKAAQFKVSCASPHRRTSSSSHNSAFFIFMETS